MKNEDMITPRYVFIVDIRENSQRHPEESRLNWVMRWEGGERERERAKESRDGSQKKLSLHREGRWKPSPWEGGV